jgi:hypothetical protein
LTAVQRLQRVYCEVGLSAAPLRPDSSRSNEQNALARVGVHILLQFTGALGKLKLVSYGAA